MRGSIPLVLGCALLLAPPAIGDEVVTADPIIARYVATQVVDSELAFLSLRRIQGGTRTDDERILIMTLKQGDRRSSLMRIQRPRDLEGVTTLRVGEPDEDPASSSTCPRGTRPDG